MYFSAFSLISAPILVLTKEIAITSYPIFTRSGMIVNSRISPSFTSLFHILLTIACDTPRTFAKSLSLLLEFFNNSRRSFFIVFFIHNNLSDGFFSIQISFSVLSKFVKEEPYACHPIVNDSERKERGSLRGIPRVFPIVLLCVYVFKNCAKLF